MSVGWKIQKKRRVGPCPQRERRGGKKNNNKIKKHGKRNKKKKDKQMKKGIKKKDEQKVH